MAPDWTRTMNRPYSSISYTWRNVGGPNLVDWLIKEILKTLDTPPEDWHRTWQWWFGSEDFPLPGGPYSQVNQPLMFWGVFWPIGSMYDICTYIYHKIQPNVGKYTIDGSYGWDFLSLTFKFSFPRSWSQIMLQLNKMLTAHSGYGASWGEPCDFWF